MLQNSSDHRVQSCAERFFDVARLYSEIVAGSLTNLENFRKVLFRSASKEMKKKNVLLINVLFPQSRFVDLALLRNVRFLSKKDKKLPSATDMHYFILPAM